MPYSSVQKDFYLFPVSGVYYVQFRDPLTRIIQAKRSSGLRNRTLADKWAKKEFERMLDEVGRVTEITFAEYSERFYIDGCPHEKSRKSEDKTFGNSTRIDYRRKIETHILPDTISRMRLYDIKRSDCLNLRDRLIDKLGYSRTAELTLVAFKNIMHEALDRGLIDSDPTIKVKIKAKKGKRAATTVDGLKNILLKKYWYNKTIWLAAMTIAITGIRVSELSGLCWRHFIVDSDNPKNDIVKIMQAYRKIEGGIKGTKSGKPRKAPYPKVLQLLLEPLRGEPDNYVFSIKTDDDKPQPLAYSALRSAMRRAMARVVIESIKKKKEEAGDISDVTKAELKEGMNKIPSITLHGLRHSINTALLDAGVNPELLRASFGWVDEETQEGYTHRELFDLTPQREATEKLFQGFIGEENG